MKATNKDMSKLARKDEGLIMQVQAIEATVLTVESWGRYTTDLGSWISKAMYISI
jgi:hypothetical protein